MFCIHIVYRGIRILHELFVNASSISLCVWFFIHIGYRVSWFFLSCLYVILKHHFLCVFFIHIGYRGIIILHELSQCDSSNFLWVWLCILNGYRGITILCELSYMILQFRFMCDFVFTLWMWTFWTGLNCFLALRRQNKHQIDPTATENTTRLI